MFSDGRQLFSLKRCHSAHRCDRCGDLFRQRPFDVDVARWRYYDDAAGAAVCAVGVIQTLCWGRSELLHSNNGAGGDR